MWLSGVGLELYVGQFYASGRAPAVVYPVGARGEGPLARVL